ncbi:hypothetical protein WICMUC_002111 [Wickerhamomyces mucosus]|uniref:Uncharacterized protein n=1 Tax=Wickerhamomyces mucosus TaxID=1378264 RepID=A0A9P8PRG9_9ASCO|nr:hypothetical protein WICMUC_002111 [Wickerhamomyces mucosus]
METLPSYNESINDFIQPPSYHKTICDSPLPYSSYSQELVSEYFKFYNYIPIQFITRIDQLPDNNELYQKLKYSTDILNYDIISRQDIWDTYQCVKLLLQDKLIQIQRNYKFIETHIITQGDNYYIDNLRIDTLINFGKIYTKLKIELNNLFELFQKYDSLNSNYKLSLIKILSSIDQSRYNNHDNNNNNNNVDKDELIILNYNISLIKTKINQLSCTNDVSFVLKERARIYNDAKQVVSNQQLILQSI